MGVDRHPHAGRKVLKPKGLEELGHKPKDGEYGSNMK